MVNSVLHYMLSNLSDCPSRVERHVKNNRTEAERFLHTRAQYTVHSIHQRSHLHLYRHRRELSGNASPRHVHHTLGLIL